MELLLIAIVISAMLVFYPIRVRPRSQADLISPGSVSATGKVRSFDASYLRDRDRIPDSFFEYTNSYRRSCSICDSEPCSLCGSSDCGSEYYICSLCSGCGDDNCQQCGKRVGGASDFSRYRLGDSADSMFGNNEAFVSEDFDTGLYNHDSLMPTSSFSDLAVGHGEPVTEVFYFEGKRYIAATYADTIVIRPDF